MRKLAFINDVLIKGYYEGHAGFIITTQLLALNGGVIEDSPTMQVEEKSNDVRCTATKGGDRLRYG